MRVKEIWREKAETLLLNMYPDKRDEIKIYLDEKLKESDDTKLFFRNLYKDEYDSIELDTIFNTIDKEGLIVGANGTYTFNHSRGIAETSQVLLDSLNRRAEEKKLGLEAEARGDKEAARRHDNAQTHQKSIINSFYGIQLQSGSFLHNPDTASMITTQARELISEMMWSLEKFLDGNMQFSDFNELGGYFANIQEQEKNKVFDSLITYWPTDNDIRERVNVLAEQINASNKHDNEVVLGFQDWATNMDKDSKCRLYYKNNLFVFLEKNPNVFKMISDMIDSGVSFHNPVMGEAPEIFDKGTRAVYDILREFVSQNENTYDRVEKYQKLYRNVVVISDTDSVMVNLNPWVEKMHRLRGYVDNLDDDEVVYRIVNIGSYLCTLLCKDAGERYTKECRVPEEYRYRIYMKNEFYFPSVIIYKGAKKNYSAFCTLREGKKVAKLSNTGLALTASNMNSIVREAFDDILLNRIHKAKDIDLMGIYGEIITVENKLRSLLESGDPSIGLSGNYKDETMVDNPYHMYHIRGGIVWNRIYPDNINRGGNKIFIFPMNINSMKDIDDLKSSFPKIYSTIRDEVFMDENLGKYGITYISVPDSLEKLPEWMIPYIDIDKIIDSHMSPMKRLLPSIGLHINRINSNKSSHSSLINI